MKLKKVFAWHNMEYEVGEVAERGKLSITGSAAL